MFQNAGNRFRGGCKQPQIPSIQRSGRTEFEVFGVVDELSSVATFLDKDDFGLASRFERFWPSSRGWLLSMNWDQ